VESGKVVLIFPEGTRQTDGQLGEFKPMVGKLALDTRTPILPLWIDGAYASLPKGSAIPKARGITVHIGPTLDVENLERLTDGMKASKAARRVAHMAREAVASLAGGTVYTLDGLEKADFLDEPAKLLSPTEKVEIAVKSLAGRFDAERVQRDVVWYFSLGDKTGPRWTVTLTGDGVVVKPGRPSGNADCVVKTSEDIFTRLVQDAYLPDPSEFISGTIKTNDIPLLIEFSRVFDLSDVSSLGF
jgi:long-chain acyl-CoA synthetase